MTYPFIHQLDSKDCGAACLSMVSKYYGQDISIQYFRNKGQIGKLGASLLGISEAAEGVGFHTMAVKASLDDLISDAKLPVIVHWDQNHFVVLYKIGKSFWTREKFAVVGDPATGIVRYSLSEFGDHWISDKTIDQGKGIALLMDPTSDFHTSASILAQEKNEAKELASTSIFKYLIPHKKFVLQIFFGLVIGLIIQLFLPFLAKSVIDTGITTGNFHFIFVVLLAQLALVSGRLIVEFIRGWILLHISTRINLSILTDFLIKLMKLPIGFFDSKNTGDILQRMNDHNRIESFLTGSSLSFLFSLINIIVLSIVLAIFNVYIFSAFCVGSILYGLWVVVFLKKRREIDFKRFDVGSKEQSLTIQLIQGMQEIKLNGVEKEMRWKWEKIKAKLFKLSIVGLVVNQWQQTGAFLINETKNIFITFLSAKSVIDGHMTLGEMLAVQYILGQLSSPIEQIVSFIQNLQNARLSFNRLNEIHSLENEEPVGLYNNYDINELTSQVKSGNGMTSQQKEENENSQNLLFSKHVIKDYDNYFQRKYQSIKLENLFFTYAGAGNDPVIKGISLDIPIGKTTAIVGVSGSGKTTLLKLLLKFYEIQGGQIYLSGKKQYEPEVYEANKLYLSQVGHKKWRSHCGVVMQESYIFSDTICGNIAVGASDIDFALLRHSLEVANITDFIDSLPLGVNTKIGSEGMGISMGQRQRILIARAVYRNPDFIFFDEATNSLDANNESIIINNLNNFFKGKTVIIVAHRLSTVRNADQIVVLNKGMISERGKHSDLISLRGEYYSLVKNQLELSA